MSVLRPGVAVPYPLHRARAYDNAAISALLELCRALIGSAPVQYQGQAAGRGGDDVGVIGVHIGAHMSALAGPNDVLVSSTLRDLVIGSGLDRYPTPGEAIEVEEELAVE